jgi:hypothetical protein
LLHPVSIFTVCWGAGLVGYCELGRDKDKDKHNMRARCELMCPWSEIRGRLDLNSVHRLELPSDVCNSGNVANLTAGQLQHTMIKAYRRSTGDTDLVVAEDIRTPQALLRTVSYVEANMLHVLLTNLTRDPDATADWEQAADASEFIFVYLFVFDRYRMILKDVNLSASESAEDDSLKRDVVERIIRWLIALGHLLLSCESTRNTFASNHLRHNTQVLMDAMKTLQALYRRPSICNDIPQTVFAAATSASSSSSSSDRAAASLVGEFTAYYLVMCSSIGKAEFVRELRQLPAAVVTDPHVQTVIRLHTAGSVGMCNYELVFRTLRGDTAAAVTPLLLCLLAMSGWVEPVRLAAVLAWSHAYLKQSLFPYSDVQRLLAFDGCEHVHQFAASCGLDFTDGSDVPDSKASAATGRNSTPENCSLSIQRLNVNFVAAVMRKREEAIAGASSSSMESTLAATARAKVDSNKLRSEFIRTALLVSLSSA